MAGQDDDTEKSFEPTPKKLQDARKKGDVARSSDLNTTAAYIGLFLALLIAAPGALADGLTALLVMLDQAPNLAELFFKRADHAPLAQMLGQMGMFLLILFLTPAVLVLLSAIAQNSITFAPTKIAPKLNKISPISNAKQKYGASGLFEFFKSFVKLLLYGVCLALFLHARLADLVATPLLDARQVVLYLGDLFLGFLAIVIAVSAAIGVVDFVFQYTEHRRKLRMSRKEVTDETKEAEGDPYMKQERRSRGREIAMNQTLQDVETADVVIVNPTHYAVALKWSRLPGEAPVCVAKGVDEFAAAIRERAVEHAVPLHEDPPTARALYSTTRVGDEIPYDLYRAVAAAIRFAETMRRKAKQRGFS